MQKDSLSCWSLILVALVFGTHLPASVAESSKSPVSGDMPAEVVYARIVSYFDLVSARLDAELSSAHRLAIALLSRKQAREIALPILVPKSICNNRVFR